MVSAFMAIVFASYTPFEIEGLTTWANELERLHNLRRQGL